MLKKLLLTLALTLIPAGAALANDVPVVPENEAPAVTATAEVACAQPEQNLPLFTAKVEQRINSCSTDCRNEYVACRAACPDRICVGECADALDVCLSFC